MKTGQEIKEWLETRRWFSKFKRNLEKEAKLHQNLPKFCLFAGIFVCGLSFYGAMLSALAGDWIPSIAQLIGSVLLAISSIRFLKDVWGTHGR